MTRFWALTVGAATLTFALVGTPRTHAQDNKASPRERAGAVEAATELYRQVLAMWPDDTFARESLLDLLRDLRERHGLTYVFISHDLKVVRSIADHVIVMRDGVIVEEGTTQEVLERPKTAYAAALVKASFDLVADDTGAVRA